MADPFWELPEEPERNQAAAAQPAKPVSRRRLWTLRIVKTIAALTALTMVSLTATVVIGYQRTVLPNANKDFQTATSFVYYNDGKDQLGTFEVQNRQPLTYQEMPENIKQAVVAAENRSFWTDRGISIRGMIRSAYVIARGGDVQGGSTITQQYIKIMYLTQDRTFTRKFKELFLAAKVSRQLSKEEILTGYLNTIYFGRDAYGIQAASQAYFDVDAKDLTDPQAAVLASVLNSPNNLDPAEGDNNAARLLDRYRYVLQSMSETGALTAQEATTHSRQLPPFPKIKVNQRYGGTRGFLLKMVQKELAAAGFDSSKINGGGLKITTTFDRTAQRAAVESAEKYTEQAAEAADEKASNLHAAIASVEVGTGEVLAVYGGSDYIENSRNWATTPRPTASTFKAYALAAGLEDGYSLLSRFNGNTFTPPGDSSSVRNEYSYQYGSVNLVKATADSINTAFVDLTTTMDDGPEKIADMAEAAGAPKGPGWDLGSRIPLGTAEVSPLAQANAYATFANNGVHVQQHVVREVRDANNKVIYKAQPEENRAMSGDIADDVTYALSSVVEQGTGRSVRTLNRPVAGKTGTKDIKDDISSAWFVAYTKQVSTAVMYVAGDTGSDDLDKYRRPGDSTFFGGTYPALTWADFMETATDGMPVEEFDDPAYVNRDKAGRQGTARQFQTRRTVPERTQDSNEVEEEPAEDVSPEPSDEEPTTSGPTDEPSGDATDEPDEPSDDPTTEKPTATSRPTTRERATQQPTREPTSRRTTSAPEEPEEPAQRNQANEEEQPGAPSAGDGG